MAKTLQFRRDSTANLASVTGAVGEIFIDTTKKTVVVMDGSTAGGYPLELQGAGTGATGVTGASGVGSNGATGVTGASGTIGVDGATGSQGVQGASGATGSNGTNGATGSAGTDGATGVTGASGVGATGSQGIQGASGSTGPQGSQGVQGASGVGATGSAGTNGASGATGTAGTNGATGIAGSNGATGVAGPTSGYLNGPITGFSLLIGATGSITSGATGNGWFGAALFVGAQGGATGPAWGASGTIRATGDITAFYTSDRTLKENINDIPNALDKVVSIGGKTFDWTDEYIANHGGADGYFLNKADFGVIAQDVQEVFPIAIRTRDDGKLAVDYDKLVALAFAAIKELKAQLDAK
jgi:hypothetical protein